MLECNFELGYKNFKGIWLSNKKFLTFKNSKNSAKMHTHIHSLLRILIYFPWQITFDACLLNLLHLPLKLFTFFFTFVTSIYVIVQSFFFYILFTFQASPIFQTNCSQMRFLPNFWCLKLHTQKNDCVSKWSKLSIF